MHRVFNGLGMKYQNEGYRPCRSFMLRGGIYGRSTRYPWRGLRTRRIFRRIIRSDWVRADQSWRGRTPNAVAFNSSHMIPVFAYEWRLQRSIHPRPPRPAKTQPVLAPEPAVVLKRAA